MRRWTVLFLTFALMLVPLVAATAAETDPAGQPRVELYITTRCPWCAKAIAFLEEKQVAYRLYDLEKDQEALQRFLQLNPRGGVPFAVIGEERILGFDPRAYAEALDLPSS